MDFTSLFWIATFIVGALLLFAQVYAIILMSDLESDFINPVDLAKSLNRYIYPEFIGHAVWTVFFLFMGDWVPFVINLPVLAYHVYIVREKTHRYDATEAFQQLPDYKKRVLIKLTFHLACFFYYMFRMIYALVTMAIAPPTQPLHVA